MAKQGLEVGPKGRPKGDSHPNSQPLTAASSPAEVGVVLAVSNTTSFQSQNYQI